MKIELTACRDVEVLNRIIRDDAVYPFIIDDACGPAEAFSVEPMLGEPGAAIFYLVTLDGAIAGCFAFLGCELHTCLLRNCRGRAAVVAGRMAIAKFEAEQGRQVVSFAWREQPQTIWYARAIGLTQRGEEPYPVTRYGKSVTRINFIHERNTQCHS